MKRVIPLFFAALALAACQTTGGSSSAASDTITRVCPPIHAALTVLENSPSVDAPLRARLVDAHPLVAVVCDGDGQVTEADLHRLEDLAIPLIIDVIADSKMDDKQKNIAILSVAVAQAVLFSMR